MRMLEVFVLGIGAACLCLLACPPDGHAEKPAGSERSSQEITAVGKGEIVRKSEKRLFKVSMFVESRDLIVGVNSLNLSVRDKRDAVVPGARVTVTPWSPEFGHGVWEKPAVSERGEGRYHVENVVLPRGGRWDIAVMVKKGAEEDRAVFPFIVGPGGKAAPQKESVKPKGKYQRTVEYYKAPNVTLLNQDGKKIKLRTFLDSGKPVVIDFIYTTCTTICPVLSAGFTNIRQRLGKDAHTVQLISISIDPEQDRPEQMKEYLSRFNAGEGWDFLTGSREDINLVLKAFDASVPDKMSHLPLFILRGPGSDQWVRIKGLISTSDLLREVREVENK